VSTSGTYTFSSPQSKDIIEDAYERVGIIPTQLDQQQIFAAERSINFILQSWINRGLNLWTVKQGMLALTNNQSAYNLPLYTSDVLEGTIRTSTRNLGGTAFSSAGGNANYAFDNNPATACTQTSPNGYISYNWNIAQYGIAMVGIQSNVTTNYTLVFEYSYDNISWNQAASIPTQNYPQGVNQWFVVPVPTPANLFRVRETGGSTLNVQELYFNTLIYDTIVTRLSRAEYIAIPNKSSTGRPTSFYVDRQINPVIYLWLTPNTQFNNFFYTYIEQIQDIGSLINNAQIPSRFLEALCSKLALSLCIKSGDLSRASILAEWAEREYAIAAEEDRERVPLRVYGDYMQGWGQI
jgi:hypothetical protein